MASNSSTSPRPNASSMSSSSSSASTLRAAGSPQAQQPRYSSPLASSPPLVSPVSTHSSPGLPASHSPLPSPTARSRPRGHSTSTLNSAASARRNRSDSAASAASFHLDVTGSTPAESSWDLPLRSTFRDRSASHSASTSNGTSPAPSTANLTISPSRGITNLADAGASVSTWWNHDTRPSARPWVTVFSVSSFKPSESGKPANEQESGWMRCRRRVAHATAAVLPYAETAGDILHEALYHGIDLLEFAPIPGLAPAAQLLLGIWDSLQMVDTNRLSCLRLTERCADILLSVRVEIKEAGDEVSQELSGPIKRLWEVFKNVHDLLLKQTNRPFLKRYLKRDEIQKEIQSCDAMLSEALGMFGLSIQIRILKQLQAYERQRVKDTKEVLEKLEHRNRAEHDALGISLGQDDEVEEVGDVLGGLVGLPSPASDFPDPEAYSPTIPTSSTLGISLGEGDIMSRLKEVREQQNEQDRQGDWMDLRGLMRTALQTSSDQEMIGVLQVGREEMPEAIKTLQRALENVLESEQSGNSEVVVIPPSTVDEPDSIIPPIPEERTPKKPTIPGVITRGKLTRRLTGQGKKAKDKSPIPAPKSAPGSSTTSPAMAPIEVGNGTAKGVRGKLVRSMSRKTTASEKSGRPGTAGTTGSTSGATTSSGPSIAKDTLDREFIESGIDAMRRMSRPMYYDDSSDDIEEAVTTTPGTLPSWTITRFEVDRDVKIGFGFFSDVYRGTWRGKAVAIKVLADTTPRNLFIREISIWKTLRHRNVLELYGASSATGDPPWFFVSPYYKRGSLSQFLRQQAMNLEASSPSPRQSTLPTHSPGHRNSPSLPNYTPPSGQRPSPSSLPANSMPASPSAATLTPSMGRGRAGSVGSAPASTNHSPSPPGRGSLDLRQRVLSAGSTNEREKERERALDLLRYMHEIAKGMQYLHENGVLHGDLKAANVLVDDKLHCVIADFGQSEMKSEAYRLSGTSPPHGALRWQSPELMAGTSQLTAQVDVYAFSMTCLEVLAMGKVFWSMHDDTDVRRLVLYDRSRPPIPVSKWNSLALDKLIRAGWDEKPEARPPFSQIAMELRFLRSVAAGASTSREFDDNTPSPRLDWEIPSRPSPDMRPIPLPATSSSPPRDTILGSSPLSDSTFHTARGSTPSPFGTLSSHNEDTVRSDRPSERVVYKSRPGSAASSLFTSTDDTDDESGASSTRKAYEHLEGYDSPPPENDNHRMRKDEMRYRMHLSRDEFHPSLTLPLWSPSHLPLGTVGYLSKPEGSFVPLMDAFRPQKSKEPRIKSLPSIYGYGSVNTDGRQRVDKRNMAQRGLDAIAGFLSFKTGGDQPVSRRISYPLRAGHRAAYLYAETTMYRYIEDPAAPKKWFEANADVVLQEFGNDHNIGKEDLFMVIGALDAPDWGLFVSHKHPDGQAHFSVYASPRNGSPWGTFTTDTVLPDGIAGPKYSETSAIKPHTASKISEGKGGVDKWDTVLVARLRFKPDVAEPTLL